MQDFINSKQSGKPILEVFVCYLVCWRCYKSRFVGFFWSAHRLGFPGFVKIDLFGVVSCTCWGSYYFLLFKFLGMINDCFACFCLAKVFCFFLLGLSHCVVSHHVNQTERWDVSQFYLCNEENTLFVASEPLIHLHRIQCTFRFARAATECFVSG